MGDHIALIRTFYTAFARADVETMIECYHDEIQFEDPVFGKLHGAKVHNMWRMLVRPGIQITFSEVTANTKTGSANWIAEYTFGKSQRNVVNRVQAKFEFKDDKIILHKDHFDFWKWSRQALGLPGLLFGWTSWFRKKVTRKVLVRLVRFQ